MATFFPAGDVYRATDVAENHHGISIQDAWPVSALCHSWESGSRLEKVPRFSTIRMFDAFEGPMWRDQSSLRLAACKTLCDSSG